MEPPTNPGRFSLAQEPCLAFFLESIAFSFDVEGGGVMEETVQDGGGQDLVVEDLPPVQEALVAGDDEAGPFVPADEEAEEEAGLLPAQGQIPDLVQDQHLGVGELLEDLVQAVLVGGPGPAGS
jgi:hypothetical protein